MRRPETHPQVPQTIPPTHSCTPTCPTQRRTAQPDMQHTNWRRCQATRCPPRMRRPETHPQVPQTIPPRQSCTPTCPTPRRTAQPDMQHTNWRHSQTTQCLPRKRRPETHPQVPQTIPPTHSYTQTSPTNSQIGQEDTRCTSWTRWWKQWSPSCTRRTDSTPPCWMRSPPRMPSTWWRQWKQTFLLSTSHTRTVRPHCSPSPPHTLYRRWSRQRLHKTPSHNPGRTRSMPWQRNPAHTSRRPTAP